MPHFRVDDGLDSHPKIERAGDDAIGMWTRAGSWSMRYLTDGFVPEWWVKKQPNGTRKARKLVAAGLWIDGQQRDNERGYQFHDFVGPGRQDSREKIEADRELARKRKQKSRGMSQQESLEESHRDNPRDRHRESHQESRRSPGYTQPNPTQVSTPVETSGGDLTKATREPPSPHCPKHPGGTDHPCGACADARRTRQDWDAGHANDRTNALGAFWAEVRACPDCDERGYTEPEAEAGRLRRCPNHDWKAIQNA